MCACESERETDREARLYLLRVARVVSTNERRRSVCRHGLTGVTPAHPGRERLSLTVCVHTLQYETFNTGQKTKKITY